MALTGARDKSPLALCGDVEVRNLQRTAFNPREPAHTKTSQQIVPTDFPCLPRHQSKKQTNEQIDALSDRFQQAMLLDLGNDNVMPTNRHTLTCGRYVEQTNEQPNCNISCIDANSSPYSCHSCYRREAHLMQQKRQTGTIRPPGRT
jgi:hypothetical protein